jgi:hypothetical protein
MQGDVILMIHVVNGECQIFKNGENDRIEILSEISMRLMPCLTLVDIIGALVDLPLKKEKVLFFDDGLRLLFRRTGVDDGIRVRIDIKSSGSSREALPIIIRELTGKWDDFYGKRDYPDDKMERSMHIITKRRSNYKKCKEMLF